MTVWLLRHGETEGNSQGRYLGRTDVPLSAKGRTALVSAEISPETVYTSPLQRTVQTAQILFPKACQIAVPELQEMDFGDFEGRTYQEMSDDPAYRRWVDGGCLGPTPNGESKAEFCTRICAAFVRLADQTLADGKTDLVIVAHGGTQMAVMERYVKPHQAYFSWHRPPGGGYVLDASGWRQAQCLTLLKTVQYTKGDLI